MTRDDWLDRFASELGIAAPTADEVETLLDLAGAAARASERTAAPLTCWLVGRAGLDPAEALAQAQRLAARVGGHTAGG